MIQRRDKTIVYYNNALWGLAEELCKDIIFEDLIDTITHTYTIHFVVRRLKDRLKLKLRNK